MSDPVEATRRSIFAALVAGLPAGSALAAELTAEFPRNGQHRGSLAMATSGVSQAEEGARGRLVPDRLSEVASVKDFGALGDGSTDDSTAFQAAVNRCKFLFVPPGRYKFGRTVKLADGQRIFGGGKSAWEPYSDAQFPNVTRSEILVDGILAFDASGTNSVAIEGLAIKAVGGRQSRWGWPAGKQAGAMGVHITGSTQFEARDISFQGLEVAIDSNQSPGSPDTQMPSITEWTATDCGVVFRFGNASSKLYTVRDARIAGCVVAVHCDSMIDAHRCDGLRLENLRLFTGNGRSIYIRDTPFVSCNAVTVFETSHDQITLKDCVYASLAGLLLARAGAYKGARPYPQQVALTLDGCSDVSVEGLIHQPTGKAISIVDCANVRIGCAVGMPFWTTGNQNNQDGAISIRSSTAIGIHASFGGSGIDYWASVWADLQSAQTLSGSVSSDRSIGVVRATQLQSEGGYKFGVPTSTKVSARAKFIFGQIRVFIPAGKSFKPRSVEITDFPAQLCITSNVDRKIVIWKNKEELFNEGGARTSLGSISIEDKPLYDNSLGPSGWYSIDLALYNPSSDVITIPAGTEVRISTAII